MNVRGIRLPPLNLKETSVANLYLIERTDDTLEFETYEYAVVVAHDEDGSKKIHPGSDEEYEFVWSDQDFMWNTKFETAMSHFGSESWLPPSRVSATLIGTAAPHLKTGTVVCASFNAG